MDGSGGFGARSHGITFMMDLDDADSLASRCSIDDVVGGAIVNLLVLKG
jgi:hypothetical protein